MKRFSAFIVTILITLTLAPTAFANSKQEANALNIDQLSSKIAEYEKKDIVLTGTVLGACGSGCKLWVGNENYKQGDPVALVWAKDNAFKFKGGIVGQKVTLKGFAVAKYVSLCPTEQKEQEKKKAEQKGDDKKNCDPFKKEGDKQEEAREVQSITFFATSIEYLK